MRAYNLLRLHSQQHDLGRHVETHTDDARANAGGDEKVMTIFENVAAGVALAVVRRMDDAADERKPDLPAVSMTRQ